MPKNNFGGVSVLESSVITPPQRVSSEKFRRAFFSRHLWTDGARSTFQYFENVKTFSSASSGLP